MERQLEELTKIINTSNNKLDMLSALVTEIKYEVTGTPGSDNGLRHKVTALEHQIEVITDKFEVYKESTTSKLTLLDRDHERLRVKFTTLTNYTIGVIICSGSIIAFLLNFLFK